MIKPRNLAMLMQRLADLVSTSVYAEARPTCFVSYHDADFSEVEGFIRQFGTEFVPRCIGVTDQDRFVGSLDDHYIMSCVREECLSDSTVTIVLVGKETWHQRFVDWEIAASLISSSTRTRNGILALPLPSMRNRVILPERIRDNLAAGDGALPCATFESYPTSRDSFAAQLGRAAGARSDASIEVHNSRPLRRTDSP